MNDLFDSDQDEPSGPERAKLTPDELRILIEADGQGFYVQSGCRLCVLNAWRDRCRRAGLPCVTVVQSATQARIYRDGRPVCTVAADQWRQAAKAAAHVQAGA